MSALMIASSGWAAILDKPIRQTQPLPGLSRIRMAGLSLPEKLGVFSSAGKWPLLVGRRSKTVVGKTGARLFRLYGAESADL